jgi:hypothetical protein
MLLKLGFSNELKIKATEGSRVVLTIQLKGTLETHISAK